MHTVRTFLPAILLLLSLGQQPVAGEGMTEEGQDWRGVKGEAALFQIETLSADRVVLIFFDFYCPTCQKSARGKNRLADQMREDLPAVPIIGVGYGDTAFETDLFRKKFKLGFPCLSDRDKTFSEGFRVVRTPTFIVLDRETPDSGFGEVYRHEGYLGREHIRAIMEHLERPK